MKNIVVRALSGAVYVAVLVAGVLCGPYALVVMLLLLATLAVNEFLGMTRHMINDLTPTSDKMLRCLDCIGAYALIMTTSTGIINNGILYWMLYLIVRMCAQLWIKGQNAITSLSLSFMSQLYVALPIALMGVIYYAFSPAMLLLLFVLVWVNDTFAFLTGCTLGRHRLFERISPKKSWEGFIGGAIFAIIAAILAAELLPEYFHIAPWQMGVIGLMVTISATLGDLIESLIKRTLGVKDSGRLIPGHGGILDRIDSLLLVIPVSLLTLILI